VRWGSPWFLVLLALLPLLWREAARPLRRAALSYPTLSILRAVSVHGAGRRRVVLLMLRTMVLALLVVSLARPQAGSATARVYREGVDIVLAVDISGSMLAEDFTLGEKRASRLDVVKSVVADFIAARPNDRIGLVLFAARAYTQCPLTLDHGWLLQNLARARTGMIEDGTAVGSGIATAVSRLRASTAKSKFAVLLTDGQQNAGEISPRTAAEAAAAVGVRVYTVGAGTRGMAPYPTTDFFGNKVYRPVAVDIDEDALRTVAEITGARYFRATDTKSLREVYEEIDKAERSDIEAPEYTEYAELYPWLLWPAVLLLGIELVLAHTRLRKLP
jgi:Ca-activated chloride channel family protein